jgi:hypothetical protein
MSSYFDAPRLPRGFRVALALSVLAHALLLWMPMKNPVSIGETMSAVMAPPMSVVILPPDASPTAAPAAEPSVAPAPITPPVRTARPGTPAPRESPKVVTPAAPVAPAPPVPAPSPDRAPPIDMMAMLKAARDRRRAAEEAAARGPSDAEAATANINRNLASLRTGREGTSGVFQILRKGTRTAEFAFNGWQPDGSRKWREVIEVDAGLGGDVELAIVRRMIALIRTHYQGDFNWESHRLGRVIVLSARTEDTAGLEDFLMREFFDTRVLRTPR